MPPVIVDSRGDERIARGRVNHVVKFHIGVNHRPDALSGGGGAPGSDHHRVKLSVGQHGAAGREAVEHCADLIDLGDRLRFERRHPQATAPGIDDEAILLEQTQRLQHRLTRDVKRSSEILLGEPPPGD